MPIKVSFVVDLFFLFFFFKQKTAYEMRISDWSSDVCSSDLLPEDWEPRPQLLFRSAAFGDDVDRPLQKSDGSWTYFASDIAYHFGKVNRGFENLIDVWGADHGGYVKRVNAAVQALTGGKAEIDEIGRAHV